MANVKVVIDVDSGDVTFAGDRVLTLTQQVKLLKQELQKVPEGTKEFTLLSQKFNETKDSLDRVNVKSKELFGTFSSLPGPIGAVSGQLDNTVGVLKTFSSLKFSDIKTQFVELGKDLTTVASNIGKLTGITAAYTVVARGLSTAFQAVGISATTATVAARAFSAALIGTGIGIAVVAIGFLVEKLIDLYKAYGDNTKELGALNDQLAEYNSLVAKSAQNNKVIFDLNNARLKAEGASDTELYNNKIKFLDREILAIENNIKDKGIFYRAELKLLADNQGSIKTATEKYNKEINELEAKKKDLRAQKTIEGYAEQGKLREANEEKDKKAAEREKERIEKAKQQRLKDLAEIDKNEKAAALSLFDIRSQEMIKIVADYDEKISLAAQYGKDIIVLSDARDKALRELNNKFAAEDKAAADKIAEERIRTNEAAFEYQRKQFEELRTLDEQRADNVLLQNSIITQSWISLGNNISSVLGSLANTFSGNETLQKIFAVTQVAVNTASSIGSILLSGKQQQADYNKAIAAGNSTIAIGIANAFIPGMQVLAAGQLASGKAAVAAGVAGKLTSATNTKVQAIAAGVIGAAQIAAILSAKKSASSSSEGSGDSGGASTPAFAAPAIGAPQIGATSAQTGTIAGIAAGTMAANQSTDRPLKAYVVGNDITTEQQLNRRLRTMARLGG